MHLFFTYNLFICHSICLIARSTLIFSLHIHLFLYFTSQLSTPQNFISNEYFDINYIFHLTLSTSPLGTALVLSLSTAPVTHPCPYRLERTKDSQTGLGLWVIILSAPLPLPQHHLSLPFLPHPPHPLTDTVNHHHLSLLAVVHTRLVKVLVTRVVSQIYTVQVRVRSLCPLLCVGCWGTYLSRRSWI